MHILYNLQCQGTTLWFQNKHVSGFLSWMQWVLPSSVWDSGVIQVCGVLTVCLKGPLPVWLRGGPWVTESTSDIVGELGGTWDYSSNPLLKKVQNPLECRNLLSLLQWVMTELGTEPRAPNPQNSLSMGHCSPSHPPLPIWFFLL